MQSIALPDCLTMARLPAVKPRRQAWIPNRMPDAGVKTAGRCA
jgi:hypothetical protein